MRLKIFSKLFKALFYRTAVKAVFTDKSGERKISLHAITIRANKYHVPGHRPATFRNGINVIGMRIRTKGAAAIWAPRLFI